jgi:hypothetical protein
MKTIKVITSCLISGEHVSTGSSFQVNDRTAVELVALGRASIVTPEIETRQPEIENRDPVTESPRKARSNKSK